jgi:hypothetical protein
MYRTKEELEKEIDNHIYDNKKEKDFDIDI